jgi:AsmA family
LVANIQGCAVKFLRTRSGLALMAALVLILFLFRPGVYKLRNRIANSIGSALGRRVALDNVRLHLLPRPGFDLEGLVIYDDPLFSAEPMIRAESVSAAIRFRSLLRGRLEIATLNASEPSINLVRNNVGHWNLASLLERNAQIPVAPTQKAASDRRPAFPYLEASGARINFKLGQTKKSYALMDADVALWQDSENSWGARIKAEPVRTDFNLTDTGLLQINATWQRSSSLRTTPLQVMVQWRNGQLGQVTKLLSGKDRGWRGGLNLTASLSGTPETLRMAGEAAIEGFHRYDIVGDENLRLVTSCSARYNAVAGALADLLCKSPVSGGTLWLHGDFAVLAQPPVYDLTLAAEKVPLASVVRLLRQSKRQLPADLTATGSLSAEFRAKRNATWSGTGAATNVRLSSNSGMDEIAIGTIPFTLIAGDSCGTLRARTRTQAKTPDSQDDCEPSGTRVRIGPVPLEINASAPIDAGGWISASGYQFFLRGDAELKNLFRLEDALGLPGARPAAKGAAKLDVGISGPWLGFAAPITTGTAQLRNVRAEMRGLNTPIEIASAAVTLTPTAVLMEKLSARTGNTSWSGNLTALRRCTTPATTPGVALRAIPGCVFQFDLVADELSTADIVEWFSPHPAKRSWYRLLNSYSSDSPRSSPLLAIEANGRLRVDRFDLNKVLVTHLATQLDVDQGKLTLTALHAQLLQGTHQGNWTIDIFNPDAASRPVRYQGSGVFHDIALAQLAALINDAWITGTVEGKFEVEGSGDTFRELLARSDGRLQFVMRNGSLPHIEIPGSPVPLPVHWFAGDLRLKKGALWNLSAGRLESHDGVYHVLGTASPLAGMNFLLTRGDEQSWTLTGTLVNPQVTPGSETEAKRSDTDVKTVKP